MEIAILGGEALHRSSKAAPEGLMDKTLAQRKTTNSRTGRQQEIGYILQKIVVNTRIYENEIEIK